MCGVGDGDNGKYLFHKESYFEKDRKGFRFTIPRPSLIPSVSINVIRRPPLSMNQEKFYIGFLNILHVFFNIGYLNIFPHKYYCYLSGLIKKTSKDLLKKDEITGKKKINKNRQTINFVEYTICHCEREKDKIPE